MTTKRKSSKSPTQRALAELKKLGYLTAIVERWNPYAKIRQDLWGWCDILYLTDSSIVGLQITSGANHAARREKILAEPRALAWIKAGGIVEVWSVAKQGARGEAKAWVIRKEEIVEADFTQEVQ